MSGKANTFVAYPMRRKQDHNIAATIWVALTLFWLLFPGIVEDGGRYAASVKFWVIAGWPMWLAVNYIIYRGWLGGPKRNKK
ncbi:hypothetical protein [uncultured Tateyamaria sp.]|uniref:hypothetical protein n=1 Tax=Tateyamaria sp. 1078 TaxID=3417464 RepID=UPI00261F1538|nr:hypothetical protein [uncultured Tateyamaria sp.]